MSQLNINLTPEFEMELKEYMKRAKIAQKSEAIRRALHEAAERLRGKKEKGSFDKMLGIALKYPQNPSPRFKTDDDLWEK